MGEGCNPSFTREEVHLGGDCSQESQDGEQAQHWPCEHQHHFLLPCLASFVKSHSWEKDESISFEDEEKTPQSQTFLPNMAKPIWDENLQDTKGI